MLRQFVLVRHVPGKRAGSTDVRSNKVDLEFERGWKQGLGPDLEGGNRVAEIELQAGGRARRPGGAGKYSTVQYGVL
jgi:hypothetical protein